MSDTLRYNGNNTVPYNNSTGIINGEALLPTDIIVKGEGNSTYTIIANRQLGFGGEAKVYLAVDNKTNKEYVAKIFTSLRVDDSKVNENRALIVDFLLNHSEFDKYHIMPLIDHGIIEVTRENGIISYYFVDILPFIDINNLGTQGKVSFDVLKKQIIGSINVALKTIHDAGIVHRDIKPSNLYWYNGQLVLSDFGTACAINMNDPMALIRTDARRGTIGYVAPEVAGNYAVRASDYFSFGCTIGTLYNGEHFFRPLIERNDHIGMNRMFQLGQIPLSYSSGEDSIKDLIEGLVRITINDRLDYDGVTDWLFNYEDFKQKYVFGRAGLKGDDWEFHFEDIVCRNELELVEAMANNWEEARDYLYRGGVKGSAIVTFFNVHNQTIAMRAKRIIDGEDTETNYDLGLARFLHYLANGKTLYWKGKSFLRISDISLAIENEKEITNDILEILKQKFLSWKFEELIKSKQPNDIERESLKQLLLTATDIEDIAEKYPQLALYYAMYALAPEDKRSVPVDIDDYFANISESASVFYRKCNDLMFNNKKLAYFAYSGYKSNVITLLKMLSKINFLQDLNIFFRFFEGVCKDKSAVRKAYYELGPYSYLYWFKNNLKYYHFASPKSKKVKVKIENYKFSYHIELDEQERMFLSLSQSLEDFMLLFQGNIYLASLGISNGKEITSNEPGAFFIDDFCGRAVPPLYKRELFGKIGESAIE